MNIEQAAKIVIDRLKDLQTAEFVESVRVYPMKDRNTAGILDDEGFKDFTV